MASIEAGGLLGRSGLAPPVRATRTQLEVEYLPPYGDPEVNVVGEVATYVVLGGLAVEVLERA